MPETSSALKVLLIDDQLGDIVWLLDRIEARGFEVEIATNEKEARGCLEECGRGERNYEAAIFDVMMSIAPLEELEALDEDFFQRSQDTGIRLCQYARELDLRFPVACLTVRDDIEVKDAMDAMGIPLFNRAPEHEGESIDGFLDAHLGPLPKVLPT